MSDIDERRRAIEEGFTQEPSATEEEVDLVLDFLALTVGAGMSHAAAAREVSMSGKHIGRWMQGDIRSFRGPTDMMLRHYVGNRLLADEKGRRREIEQGEVTGMEGVPIPDPEGSPAEQLLHMLGMRAGMRRVARELTDKDLITVAYTIARADGWKREEFQKLDAWRDAILEEEQ